MKVALITVGDLKLSPYIKPYIQLLEDNNVDYVVIHWNRDGVQQYVKSEKEMVYSKPSRYGKGKLAKVIDFVGFRCFAKRIIAKEKFDKYVIFTVQTAICIKSLIKKPFILDIRDVGISKSLLFNKILSKCVETSEITFISSEGFKDILPKSDKYLISHNVPIELIDEPIREIEEKKENIRFTYLGIIRDYEGLSKIIKSCKNNTRLLLQFFGDGSALKKLEEFALEINCKNVSFYGAYRFDEKAAILSKTDIVCNYYESPGNKLAVSNKYYDSVFMGLPQVVNKNFYDYVNVQDKSLGIGLNANDINFAKDVISYYDSIKAKELKQRCKQWKDFYLHEHSKSMQLIKMFVSD